MRKWAQSLELTFDETETHALLCALLSAAEDPIAKSIINQDLLQTWIYTCQMFPGGCVVCPCENDLEFFKKVVECELERIGDLEDESPYECDNPDCATGFHRETLKHFLQKHLWIVYSE